MLLAGLAVSMLTASLGTSAANVALPTLAEDLDGRFGEAQWVALAYLLAMTATSAASGVLGDALGRPRALAIGAGVFVVASIGAAFAPSLPVLIAARVVQGMGAAVMMALPLAIARDATPSTHLGRAMGMFGTTGAIGTASGPAVGGLLLQGLGWPAIFWTMAGLGGVALALTMPSVGGLPRRERAPFDLAGVVLLTGGVALYALAVTVEEGPVVTTALIIGAVAAGAVFAIVERRAIAPVLPMRMLADRVLGIGSILNLVVGAAMMSTLVIGPFFLGGALGLGAAQIGLVMAAGPITSVCTGMIAGRVVDRCGAAGMTAAGLAVMTTGSFALALLPGWLGLPGYVAGTVLLAPGYQLFLAANNTAVLGSVTPRRRGTASGALALARNLGMVTGASLMGALYAAGAGTNEISTAPAEALRTGLLVTYVTTGIALLAAAALALLSNRAQRAVEAR